MFYIIGLIQLFKIRSNLKRETLHICIGSNYFSKVEYTFID